MADTSGRVILYDTQKKKRLFGDFDAAKGALHAITIDPKDSRLLATGGIDSKILVY